MQLLEITNRITSNNMSMNDQTETINNITSGIASENCPQKPTIDENPFSSKKRLNVPARQDFMVRQQSTALPTRNNRSNMKSLCSKIKDQSTIK